MKIWVFTVLLFYVLNNVNTSPTGSKTDEKLTLVFDCSHYPIENSLELWRDAFVNKSIEEKTVFPDNKTAQEEAKTRVLEKLKELSDSPASWNATEEQARYVKIYLRDKKRDGFYLDNNKTERLKTALAEIETKKNQFLQNIGAATPPLLFNETSLRGLSQRFLKSLTKDAQGYYKIYPGAHNTEITTYCDVEETRRLVYTAWANRGQSGNNSRILEELARLRKEVANILGHASFVDYQVAILMAKNATNVGNFLQLLASKLRPKLMKENEEYLKVKLQKCRENNDTCSPDLKMWDYLYATNYVKKENYSVDSNLVREYFPLEAIQNKMFRIFEGLLGFQIEKIESLPNKVTRYRVNDSTTGEVMGFFKMDLFPRKGKSQQAKVDALEFSCKRQNGTCQLPEAILFISVPEPTPTMPTLLAYGQMKTLFHEFGHVVHHICSKTEVSTFSGLQVQRDFVEAPSQMLENWLLEPAILKNISSHYQNKTQLSDVFAQSIIESRNVDLGYKTMRQGVFALFDYNLHVNGTNDVDQLFRDIAKQYMNITIPNNVHFPGMFGHMAGGYEGQYYTYLWSEVYSADMYLSEFKKYGIFNSTVGHEYRQKILEKGGSKDAMDLMKDFLGREPNIDAFVKLKHL